MTNTTPAWTGGDLPQFGDAEEIEISTRRPDGALRPFVPIWVVAVDGSLYVRSYRGAEGAWYRHAIKRPAGVVRAPGRQVEVAIAAAEPGVREQVDAAYRAKYARYGATYLQPMLADQAVTATLRLDPAH
ncbi:DUF2255 family protein [Amycolatopsis japonica]|uniref:DUF2255 family protein n=1 Tax=Amycolatopsis japonica TaxID=208439 RepID=UPI00366F7855